MSPVLPAKKSPVASAPRGLMGTDSGNAAESSSKLAKDAMKGARDLCKGSGQSDAIDRISEKLKGTWTS